MSDASFLSKLLLGLGILFLAALFLLLPISSTRQTNDQIRLAGLRDVLDRDGMVPPYPTSLSISFTDSPLFRVMIFVFLLAVG